MIRTVDETQREVLQDWSAKKHGFTILPPEFLPKGFISYLGEKPIIAGFRYVSDDRQAMFILYIIANPAADNAERTACFDELMSAFQNEAKELGVKMIFTSTNCGSLTNRCRKFGFLECDTDVVHLVKSVE